MQKLFCLTQRGAMGASSQCGQWAASKLTPSFYHSFLISTELGATGILNLPCAHFMYFAIWRFPTWNSKPSGEVISQSLISHAYFLFQSVVIQRHSWYLHRVNDTDPRDEPMTKTCQLSFSNDKNTGLLNALNKWNISTVHFCKVGMSNIVARVTGI